MKFLSLVGTMLLMASLTANAQKNTWIIDADGFLDNAHIKSSDATFGTPPPPPLSLTSWALNANIGRQVSNHFTVGVHLGYGRNEGVAEAIYFNQPADVLYKNTHWSAGVFGRYTKWVGKRFFIYSQLSVGAMGGDNNISQLQSHYAVSYNADAAIQQGDQTIISLFPAVGMNIIQGYGIHASVGGINYANYKVAGTTLNDFNITFGRTFSFGLQKVIGWKKTHPANSNNPK